MIVNHFFRNVESKTSAALALFGSEIGIKYFPDFVLGNSIAGVANLDVGIKIFFPAVDYNFAVLVGRCLDGIDNNVLDGTRQLDRIAEHDAFFVGFRAWNNLGLNRLRDGGDGFGTEYGRLQSK